MERWNGRVALVTGSSAGIGAAVVRALVSGGMIVVGCARRIDKMQELAEELKGSSGQFFPMKCDLGNEDEILAMFDAIRSHPELGGVDVCVNNAGLAKNAPILSGRTEDWRTMLDAISPGRVNTDFVFLMHPDNPAIAQKLCNANECLTPDDIASSLVHALHSPPHVQIHDILMRPTDYMF